MARHSLGMRGWIAGAFRTGDGHGVDCDDEGVVAGVGDWVGFRENSDEGLAVSLSYVYWDC